MCQVGECRDRSYQRKAAAPPSPARARGLTGLPSSLGKEPRSIGLYCSAIVVLYHKGFR